jgi:tRNA-specific 2-thiouridylase
MNKYNTSILHHSPGSGKKVVIAMSGGVDSSVAAILLKEQGYEVAGLALQVTDYSKYRKDDDTGTCCSIKDMEDARRVAEALHIPFYVIDTEKTFDRNVVDYFINDYLQGRTPNPCVMCNTKVKFHHLYRKAMEMGADYVATGHYARVVHEEGIGYSLFKGIDKNKDQSYFLFNLTQSQLERTLFPVGMLTKDKVREIAKKFKLPVAQKPDSQEICFVPSDDYKKFIMDRTPPQQRRKNLLLRSLQRTRQNLY